MAKEFSDKDRVVGRLNGNEVKEYRIEASNTVRVVVEARSEEEAEEIFNQKLDENYDFPYEEAEDFDGWQVENVEEA